MYTTGLLSPTLLITAIKKFYIKDPWLKHNQ